MKRFYGDCGICGGKIEIKSGYYVCNKCGTYYGEVKK